MQDLHNKINVKRAISPAAAVTDNTAFVSQVLDLRYGIEGAELLIATGSLADADATFTVLIEDSPDNSTFTAVDDKFLLGLETQASFTFAADDKVFKIGYIGTQPYLRATITPANNSGNALISAVWVTLPTIAPTPNPPV